MSRTDFLENQSKLPPVCDKGCCRTCDLPVCPPVSATQSWEYLWAFISVLMYPSDHMHTVFSIKWWWLRFPPQTRKRCSLNTDPQSLSLCSHFSESGQVDVLFVFIPSCCSCIRMTEPHGVNDQPKATLSCLWCRHWCRKKKNVGFSSTVLFWSLFARNTPPETFPSLLFPLFFLLANLPFLCHFYVCLLPRMWFILNSYCTAGFPHFSPPGLTEMVKRSQCCRIYKCIFY